MTGSDPELTLPVPLPLDDRTGPAPRIARERGAEMVAAALLEFDAHAQLAPNAGRARWSRNGTWAAAAGAVLVLAGSAAAARYYFQAERAPAPAQPAVFAPPPASPVKAPSPEAAPAPQPEATTPPEAAAPSAPAHVNPAKARMPAAREARELEDLLQKANHLRAAGNFRDAAATYAQVYERFPKSQSAYVARVAGASIELEHLSNPTRARRLFEQALRDQPRAALDLEARQGLTVALRDLEDRGAEVKALRALVQTHPDSPAARRAQVRLRELGDGDDSE